MIQEEKQNRIFDRLRTDQAATYRFEDGVYADALELTLRHQLLDPSLWKKFVHQFRLQPDADGNRWRGEYWGKMMRGAALVYQCTQNAALYELLRESVCELLGCAEPCGRISSYAPQKEFCGWDIWCRKYVLLGLQYFSEICPEEELVNQIEAVMCRHLDYILAHVGEGEGQVPIEETSNFWAGINSCSILEPVLRLWRQTGKSEYLAFAEYIICIGVGKGEKNLFTLAYQNEYAPFEYPVVKAYEVMSCFEGLAEYYCITGEEKWRVAVENFAHKIMETDLTVIGCCGCTHELFDHSAWRQTDTEYRGIMQETCVTVTWIKLCSRLLCLTGDAVYADCIEQAFYNAYLGTLNTKKMPSYSETRGKPASTPHLPTVLTFDSYSPLTAGMRGQKVGGYNTLFDNTVYGCCACIGSAGVGLLPLISHLHGEDGLTICFYLPAKVHTQTPSGKPLTVCTETAYPYDGEIRLTVKTEVSERFSVRLRIPAWSRYNTLSCNGEAVAAVAENGYVILTREWNDGDEITLTLDMRTVRILPPAGACNETLFAAYRRGPIMLASDARLGKEPDGSFLIAVEADGETCRAELATCTEIADARLCMALETTDGKALRLIDYASAGSTWEESSRCAVWLKK